MPAKVEKFPLYVVNEPAIYDDFSGGINTNPNSEQIELNELRDAINAHYNGRKLEKRQGLGEIGKIVSQEPLENIQGVFLFTFRITYLIIAANGRLYSGVLNQRSTTFLTKLPIIMAKDDNGIYTDPEFTGHGLPEYVGEDPTGNHEGYLKPYVIQGRNVHELVFQNSREIEAATYDNKLYITTGTRFIVIELIENNLFAHPVRPYLINNEEFVNIGENHLSPFPELARRIQFNTVVTSLGGVIVNRAALGAYVLTPLMNFQGNKTRRDYLFRWEKFINGNWHVIVSFKDNFNTDNEGVTRKVDRFELEVDDADRFEYRVTMAEMLKEKYSEDIEEYMFEEETLMRFLPASETFTTIADYTPDKINGVFGQSSSLLFDINIEPHSYFNTIQSCTKITSDGNKFLLYGDRFNSGQWFKTVVDNPSYITYRGGLSFKTHKNEEVIKVIPFSNNLIVFANSQNVGGSIHLVTGNGDDFVDEYYSPYRRKTINSSISCDNGKTVQVAENLLIFKYFENVYYIRSSDLNNEVIRLYNANNKIKQSSRDVEIPWDDENCLSEVTEDYYALIWKEKHILEDGELIQERPGIRVKMYYKLEERTEEGFKYPWLRDESKFFNVDHIVYLKGHPIYLYNNVLLSQTQKVYTDLNEEYPFIIKFKGLPLNYPKMYKIIENVMVYYHHNNFSSTSFSLRVQNEAGHSLLDTETSKNKTIQDLKGLRVGHRLTEQGYKLDSSIVDSRVIVAQYQFPCLLAETALKVSNDKEFSLASITYNYSVLDIPQTTAYDLYASIIRKKEV